LRWDWSVYSSLPNFLKSTQRCFNLRFGWREPCLARVVTPK
jgi:hypothetical protein